MGEVLNLKTFRDHPLFRRESPRSNFEAAADPFLFGSLDRRCTLPLNRVLGPQGADRIKDTFEPHACLLRDSSLQPVDFIMIPRGSDLAHKTALVCEMGPIYGDGPHGERILEPSRIDIFKGHSVKDLANAFRIRGHVLPETDELDGVDFRVDSPSAKTETLTFRRLDFGALWDDDFNRWTGSFLAWRKQSLFGQSRLVLGQVVYAPHKIGALQDQPEMR